jgi:hypothetical protein
MEDMAAWEMAPGHPACEEDVNRLWDICSQVGLTGNKLAQQQEGEDLRDSFTQLVDAAGLVPSSALFAVYKAGVAEAAEAEPLAKRLRGETGNHTSLALADAAALVSPKSAAGTAVSLPLSLPRLGLRPRSGIRRLRLGRATTTETERATIENNERDRWCKVLHHYLVESDTPAVRFANGCLDPERALRGFVGQGFHGTVVRQDLGYVAALAAERQGPRLARGRRGPRRLLAHSDR